MASSQTYAPREVKLKIWTNDTPRDFSYSIVSGTAEIHKTVCEQGKPFLYGGVICTSFSCILICNENDNVDLDGKHLQITAIENGVESVLLYDMQVETFEQLNNGNYKLVSYDALHFIQNTDLTYWLKNTFSGYVNVPLEDMLYLICQKLGLKYDSVPTPEKKGIRFDPNFYKLSENSIVTGTLILRHLAIMSASFALIDCTTGYLILSKIKLPGDDVYDVANVTDKKITPLYDGYSIANIESQNISDANNPYIYNDDSDRLVECTPFNPDNSVAKNMWDEQISMMQSIQYTSCRAKMTVSSMDLIKTSDLQFIRIKNSKGDIYNILPCDVITKGIGLIEQEITSYSFVNGVATTAGEVQSVYDNLSRIATPYRDGLMTAQDKRNLDDLVSKVDNLAPVTSTITIPSSNANFSGTLYVATSGKVRTIYAELLTKKQITAAMNWLNVLTFQGKPIQPVGSTFPVNSTASSAPTFLSRLLTSGSFDIIARQNIASGASLRFTLTVILA